MFLGKNLIRLLLYGKYNVMILNLNRCRFKNKIEYIKKFQHRTEKKIENHFVVFAVLNFREKYNNL